MSHSRLRWSRGHGKSARPVLGRETALEQRLQAKVAVLAPPRTYVENWSHCIHADMVFLGEIGAARLEECSRCGCVVGVAR